MTKPATLAERERKSALADARRECDCLMLLLKRAIATCQVLAIERDALRVQLADMTTIEKFWVDRATNLEAEAALEAKQ